MTDEKVKALFASLGLKRNPNDLLLSFTVEAAAGGKRIKLEHFAAVKGMLNNENDLCHPKAAMKAMKDMAVQIVLELIDQGFVRPIPQDEEEPAETPETVY